MNEELTDRLDAYDQGRMDMNEQFMQIVKEGCRLTRTREELIRYINEKVDLLVNETEGRESEQI
ncbi:MAG: hypothetical protein ACP5NO_02885 [Thermoplasmata archaeon]